MVVDAERVARLVGFTAALATTAAAGSGAVTTAIAAGACRCCRRRTVFRLAVAFGLAARHQAKGRS